MSGASPSEGIGVPHAEVVVAAVQELAGLRPIFHSEADFQLAFAWTVQQRNPKARVRLETRPVPSLPWRVDCDLSIGGIRHFVEVKYKTAKVDVEVKGETFTLPHHGAHLVGRYDVVADLARVERLTVEVQGAVGHVVALSNDPMYWRVPSRPPGSDAAFRIHEGAALRGMRDWTGAPGTRAHRKEPIPLDGDYQCRWRDYSALAGKQWRWLHLFVDRR